MVGCDLSPSPIHHSKHSAHINNNNQTLVNSVTLATELVAACAPRTLHSALACLYAISTHIDDHNPYSHMPQPLTQPNRVKKCWVCGDRGTGFNYDALSCESCKVFFHRNAAKPEKLVCRKEGQCAIDFATRKSCTRCRLDKCFKVGMKWRPLHSTTSATKAHGGSPNTSQHEPDSDNSGHSSPCTSTTTTTTTATSSSCCGVPYTKQCEELSELLTEGVTEGAMMIDDGSNNYPLPNKRPISVGSSDEQSSSGAGLTGLKRKRFAADLTPSERRWIAELQSAFTVFDPPEHRLEEVGVVNSLVDGIHLPEHYVRRTVRFCKAMAAFRLLPVDDQLAILKPFFLELLSVKFCFDYNVERDGHHVLHNESGTESVFMSATACRSMKKEMSMLEDLQKSPSSLGLPTDLDKLCKKEEGVAFKHEMDNDMTIRDLMIGQLLFKPRQQLQCLEFVRYQYYLYCRLLWRYLEHKYKSRNTANRKYTALTNHLTRMDQNRVHMVTLFRTLDNGHLSDLLREIYDIAETKA